MKAAVGWLLFCDCRDLSDRTWGEQSSARHWRLLQSNWTQHDWQQCSRAVTRLLRSILEFHLGRKYVFISEGGGDFLLKSKHCPFFSCWQIQSGPKKTLAERELAALLSGWLSWATILRFRGKNSFKSWRQPSPVCLTLLCGRLWNR